MHILVFLPVFWESVLWNLSCCWSKHCLSPVPAGCEETYSHWLTGLICLVTTCLTLQPHGPQYARSPCPWPPPKLPAGFSFHPVWSHVFCMKRSDLLYGLPQEHANSTDGRMKRRLWHQGEVSILTRKVPDIPWNHLCCVWPYWLSDVTIMPRNKPAHVSEAYNSEHSFSLKFDKIVWVWLSYFGFSYAHSYVWC